MRLLFLNCSICCKFQIITQEEEKTAFPNTKEQTSVKSFLFIRFTCSLGFLPLEVSSNCTASRKCSGLKPIKT